MKKCLITLISAGVLAASAYAVPSKSTVVPEVSKKKNKKHHKKIAVALPTTPATC
jgi:hypothetical protein